MPFVKILEKKLIPAKKTRFMDEVSSETVTLKKVFFALIISVFSIFTVTVAF